MVVVNWVEEVLWIGSVGCIVEMTIDDAGGWMNTMVIHSLTEAVEREECIG